MAETQTAKKKGEDEKAALKARAEERAKSNEAAMKRMASSTPTPTQEENDLAALGVIVEEKQPDGTGPLVITKTVVANEPLAAGGYETRAMTQAKEQAAQPAPAAKK